MAVMNSKDAKKAILVGMVIGAIILVAMFYKSFFFTVQSNELGVVLRFGKFNREVGQGFHLRLPYPIENVFIPNVTQIRRAEVGYRTLKAVKKRHIPEEALMLTGDENIIDIEMVVQYVIKNAKDYLFMVRNPDLTIKSTSEAVLRHVIGRHGIDEALTTGRAAIQDEISGKIQELLDVYKTGLRVQQVQLQEVHPPQAVVDAFEEVQRAKEDRETKINSAIGYKNDIIPRARGQAQEKIFNAEGYKAKRIAEAKGDADKFIQMYNKYRTAKSVTKKRIYLETMQEVLPGIKKYILPGKGSGTLNLLNLNK
jgi:membrane protease subunit HflK